MKVIRKEEGIAQPYYDIFVVVEGFCINTVTMCWIVVAPLLSLKGFASSFHDDPVLKQPALLFLWRSWGYMIIVCGLVQVSVLQVCSPEITARVLISLMVGDVLHLLIFAPFFYGFGKLDIPTVFGVLEATSVFICRCTWLFLHWKEWRPKLVHIPIITKHSKLGILYYFFVFHTIGSLIYCLWVIQDSASFINLFGSYVHDQTSSDIMEHPVTFLMILCFGYMTFVLLLLEVSLLTFGNEYEITATMLAYAFGDIIRFALLALSLDPLVLGKAGFYMSEFAIYCDIFTFLLRSAWILNHREIAASVVTNLYPLTRRPSRIKSTKSD